MADKRNEAAELQRGLEPKLDIIRAKTKQLQSQVGETCVLIQVTQKYNAMLLNL